MALEIYNIGGSQTSGIDEGIRGMEIMYNKISIYWMDLSVSEQPWSVLTLSLFALIKWQGRLPPPTNNYSAAVGCQALYCSLLVSDRINN